MYYNRYLYIVSHPIWTASLWRRHFDSPFYRCVNWRSEKSAARSCLEFKFVWLQSQCSSYQKKKKKKERNVSCDSLPGLPHSDLPALSYSWVNQVSACGVGSVEHSGPSWDPFKRRANLSIISGLTESLIDAFFPLLGVNDHLEEKDWDLRPAGSVAQVTVLFEFGILICKTGSTKPL